MLDVGLHLAPLPHTSFHDLTLWSINSRAIASVRPIFLAAKDPTAAGSLEPLSWATLPVASSILPNPPPPPGIFPNMTSAAHDGATKRVDYQVGLGCLPVPHDADVCRWCAEWVVGDIPGAELQRRYNKADEAAGLGFDFCFPVLVLFMSPSLDQRDHDLETLLFRFLCLHFPNTTIPSG